METATVTNIQNFLPKMKYYASRGQMLSTYFSKYFKFSLSKEYGNYCKSLLLYIFVLEEYLKLAEESSFAEDFTIPVTDSEALMIKERAKEIIRKFSPYFTYQSN